MTVWTACIDLANPKTNWNKTPGYTEAETSAFARILDPSGAAPDSDEAAGTEDVGKFVDVWRAMHPDLRHYTYFGYRFQCRSKGIGWRLDMCAYLLPSRSPPLVSSASSSYVRVCGSTGIWREMLMRSSVLCTVVVSERFVDRVKMCEIRSEIYGASDHCPVTLELEGVL